MYASLVPSVRENFGSYLLDFQRRIDASWFLIQDFNEILRSSEVKGGVFSRHRASMFDQVLHSCSLINLGPVGSVFTWARHAQGFKRILKRLDRSLFESCTSNLKLCMHHATQLKNCT